MKRRLMSLLLVLCMLLSMIPAVSAAGSSLPFNDVPANSWYYGAVKYVYENSLMSGTSSTTFSPGVKMDRGMFVTVLGRMVGITAGNYDYNYFPDVNINAYYAPYVNWAAANGIVKGNGSGVFEPERSITRQEMALIFSRYLDMAGVEFPEAEGAVEFTDMAQVASWARDGVEKIRTTGLMKGGSDGSFKPLNTAMRSEAATVFMRFKQNLDMVGAQRECTVTFDNNFGDAGVFDEITVMSGEPVEHPGIAVRNGYNFSGWYLDPEATVLYDFTGLISDDLTLYAGWTQEGTTGDITASYDGGDTIYSILDVTVDGRKVTATVNAPEKCILAITFGDEDTGATIATAGARVPARSETVAVSANVSTTLPDNFLITARLLDGENNVKATYVCDTYTSVYEEFAAQTIYDFPEDTVLAFDGSEDNNFGVLSDEVQGISSEGDTNRATFDDTAYTITNADDQVQSLTPGDKIMLMADGEPALVKVEDITVGDDGTVTIVPDTDNSVEEFYKVLKVDMSVTAQPEDVNMENADEGVTLVEPEDGDRLQSIEDVNLNESVSKNLILDCAPFSNDFFEFKFGGSASVTAKLVIVYDLVLFGEDYLKFHFTTDYSTDFDISIMAKASTEELNAPKKTNKEINLGEIEIPFGVVGLAAYVDLKTCINASLKAGLTYNASSDVTTGFKYDTVNGRRDVDEKSFTHDLSCDGTVEITFGPKPAAGISFLDEALEAEVSCFIGAKAVANAEVPIAQGGDSQHGCFLCVDGEIFACVTPTFELKYHITDALSGTPISLTPFELERSLAEFYVSVLNDVDSCFQGQLHMDWDDCPNNRYKTTLKAQDVNGNDVAAMITVTGPDGQVRDTVSSGDHTYLYNKTYTASAVIDGVSISRSFTVCGGPQTVILSAEHQDGELSGRVTDAEENDPISGANVGAYQNGVLVASTDTDYNGDFSMPLAEGEYEVKIGAQGYITYTTTTTIYPSDTRYLSTSLMVREEENMGGLSGTITDAVTGRPISGVTLTVYNEWNNTEGTPVTTMTTNSSGKYVYSTWEVFGIVWGLPIGNYTIKATHPDYNETSFNVVVLPEIINGNQNATMNPLSANQEYRVVLTWGAYPSDLDSHLNAVTESGSRDHIFYRDKSGYGGNLDVDDTSSYGPETITVTDFANYRDGFTYSVHDYTNKSSTSSTAMASSGATVKLYLGDELLRTYYVPTGRVGTVWNVFSVDADGHVTSINSFENISAPGSVGVSYADGMSSMKDNAYELKDYEKD